MRRPRAWLSLAVLVVSLLVATGATAAEETLQLDAAGLGAHPKFAVMDLRTAAAEVELSRSLTEVITAELKQFRGFEVVSHQEIKDMLTFEEMKRSMGCDDEDCLAEIGNALGVEYLVTGHLGRIEATYVLSVKVIDIRRAHTVGREQESYLGPPDGLLPAVRLLIRRVFRLADGGPGRLLITASEDGGAVSLDGEGVGTTPDLELPARLAAGKYRLEISKDGFFPLARDVYVEPARHTQVQLTLTAKPARWFESWWFWTIIGVVVAGGVTTGAVLGTMSADAPDTGSGVIRLEQRLRWP